MHFITLPRCSQLAVVLPTIALASAVELNLTEPAFELGKRDTFNDAQLSMYDISGIPTACGTVHSNNDFVVALNSEQFGSGFPGPNCFRNIQLTANGKTTQAQIVDDCVTCPFGGLDLTEGLFSFFASPSAGIITGSWSFI